MCKVLKKVQSCLDINKLFFKPKKLKMKKLKKRFMKIGKSVLYRKKLTTYTSFAIRRWKIASVFNLDQWNFGV